MTDSGQQHGASSRFVPTSREWQNRMINGYLV